MKQQLVRERTRNLVHTSALLLALTALLGAIGFLIAGAFGAALATGTVVLLSAVAPSASADWLLRAQGGRPLPLAAAPHLHRRVLELSQRAGLRSPPSLFWTPSLQPQAFATGQGRDAVIVVSEGLLRSLSPRQVVAVLAHEVAHLSHGDLSVMRFATAARALTGTMSRFGLLLALLNLPLMLLGAPAAPWSAVALLLVAPFIGIGLELAVSRAREHDADARAVELTGDPSALASALEHLEEIGRHPLERFFGPLVPATPEWLRTHPATASRIARLRSLERRGLWAPPPARAAQPPRRVVAAPAGQASARPFPTQRPPRVIFL